MATKYNFTMDQGATFDTTFTVLMEDRRPLDLTGVTARGQMRINYDDADPIAVFTCTIPDPTSGKIRVTLTATETAAFDFTKALYDIEIETNTNVVTRVVQGVITLSKEVTK